MNYRILLFMLIISTSCAEIKEDKKNIKIQIDSIQKINKSKYKINIKIINKNGFKWSPPIPENVMFFIPQRACQFDINGFYLLISDTNNKIINPINFISDQQFLENQLTIMRTQNKITDSLKLLEDSYLKKNKEKRKERDFYWNVKNKLLVENIFYLPKKKSITKEINLDLSVDLKKGELFSHFFYYDLRSYKKVNVQLILFSEKSRDLYLTKHQRDSLDKELGLKNIFYDTIYSNKVSLILK